jgi:predicted deacylase
LHDHNTIGAFVKKGTVLATITDPFGKFEHSKAPNDGYIINANHSPIVYQGDAIYHISKNHFKWKIIKRTLGININT